MNLTPQLRKLNQQEKVALKKRFNEGERLSQIIPFKTPFGMKVDGLNCLCNACGKSIHQDYVSVKQSAFNDTRIFDCVGICRNCSCSTEFYFRFHASGFIDTLVNSRWQLMHFEPKRFSKTKAKWWDLVGLSRKLVAYIYRAKSGK